MPIPKMLKSELATAHLLVTKKEKSIIHAIAKKERCRVSDIIKRMINGYSDFKACVQTHPDESYKQYIIE